MDLNSQVVLASPSDDDVDVSVDELAMQGVVGILDKVDPDKGELLLEFQDDVGQDCASTGVGHADAQYAALVLRDVAELLGHLPALLAE